MWLSQWWARWREALHVVQPQTVIRWHRQAFDLGVARELIETVLLVPITLAKHAQRVIRVGGSITFTSGISKDRPVIPGGSVTAAVAGSLDYFVRALARELGPTRVNVVSPGWVKTPMWDTIAGEGKNALWDEMASRLPARRIATPVSGTSSRFHGLSRQRDASTGSPYSVDSITTTGVSLDERCARCASCGRDL